MSISFEVLGDPGRDNALLATVNTGQSQHRLLFDCGEGCLDRVSRSDIQMIEGLFFSHFHIDHVAGFDSFFRANWYREDQPVRIFGPAGTREIIHHRMQGYSWNMVESAVGEVHVTERQGDVLATSRYLTAEGFAQEHSMGQRLFDGVAYAGGEFRVETMEMHHGIPSMAYIVRESDRVNVDMDKLVATQWRPGPWLADVKDMEVSEDARIKVGDEHHTVGELRNRLLVRQPGDSIAYLTDFCLESQRCEDTLVDWLAGCDVVVCENNFNDADVALAERSFHMTSSDVGRLAARVQPKKLVLFHVSDRYTAPQWEEQLAEVKSTFERVEFPPHWTIGDS